MYYITLYVPQFITYNPQLWHIDFFPKILIDHVIDIFYKYALGRPHTTRFFVCEALRMPSRH